MRVSEIAVKDQSPLQRWTDEEKNLIHQSFAKGTTEAEFKLFLYTAAKYGLDPLVKEVWCVKYGNNPASIFTGRDGFLAIAHRSGHFAGLESGTRKEGSELVGWAKIYRSDWAVPFTVEVYESEYASANNPLWRSKKRTMLTKVAESQALRKAFDIHGIYLPEEVDPQQRVAPTVVQAVKVVSATSEPTEPRTAEPTITEAEFTPAAPTATETTKPNFTEFWAAVKALEYTRDEVFAHSPTGDLTTADQQDLNDLLDILRAEKEEDNA